MERRASRLYLLCRRAGNGCRSVLYAVANIPSAVCNHCTPSSRPVDVLASSSSDSTSLHHRHWTHCSASCACACAETRRPLVRFPPARSDPTTEARDLDGRMMFLTPRTSCLLFYMWLCVGCSGVGRDMAEARNEIGLLQKQRPRPRVHHVP